MGYYLVLSRASTGRHLYMTQPMALLSMGAYTSLSAMTMVAGTEAGLQHGELEGAQASLQTGVSIAAPLGWSKLYELGVSRGHPGRFYVFAAMGQLAKLVMSASCTV